ncbi:hypothetical protein CYLTODRAFT_224177 [Cylindrobasidium torrendii FP15055 ss-10]|uniref:Secreted protein n=1 Tax=Cylindrobasidium torrendii FP15055 ss-10 TaxID=1314674 RepID=A0A0D7BIZ9_9AGAR|nr:hypothetical protein CYLTODRAFT_224177 [Cylindrobasidium torrendii FP15055 ss-10]
MSHGSHLVLLLVRIRLLHAHRSLCRRRRHERSLHRAILRVPRSRLRHRVHHRNHHQILRVRLWERLLVRHDHVRQVHHGLHRVHVLQR